MKENDLEKIERYIKGLTNDQENAWVESLFLDGENNYFLKNSLEKDWDAIVENTSISKVNLNHLLMEVHHIIRKNEILKNQRPLQKFIRIYMKTAAILLLPLLITGGLVFYYSGVHGLTKPDRESISTIYAPLGARVSFILPDSTTGMLNSGSSLSYSLPFNNNRHINLEGEAWFEVTRDEKNPFEIKTGNSTVKVLGTSFNLSAYPVENYVEVVLQKGRVDFKDNKGDKEMTVLPSERLVFENGDICKTVTDPAKYNSWTQGKLVFRNDPMSEVARRIERWYNAKVVLNDKELEKYSFRGTFQDDKLEDVLRFLSLTSPIKYKITPRLLLADGTYEKEIITICIKNPKY